ncbi:hypothetical protein EVAR_94525_1 [Eumeta japonica]|uniref:Uncharacterized protein n=1 Tax=Eumeta variegata TaxID=151549 RepID=A0A4C1UW18_EUMVA|nr:hypothetical protein EVAR_94525_1 [Eumeta japonica]
MPVGIATGAVAHIGGSEGFAIGRRSRHNFPQNIGMRFSPYKAMNLFPGHALGKCRVQPESIARSSAIADASSVYAPQPLQCPPQSLRPKLALKDSATLVTGAPPPNIAKPNLYHSFKNISIHATVSVAYKLLHRFRASDGSFSISESIEDRSMITRAGHPGLSNLSPLLQNKTSSQDETLHFLSSVFAFQSSSNVMATLAIAHRRVDVAVLLIRTSRPCRVLNTNLDGSNVGRFDGHIDNTTRQRQPTAPGRTIPKRSALGFDIAAPKSMVRGAARNSRLAFVCFVAHFTALTTYGLPGPAVCYWVIVLLALVTAVHNYAVVYWHDFPPNEDAVQGDKHVVKFRDAF